jgi:hydrogenase maturation protein HypF
MLGATKQETRVLTRMIERGVNTPLTSSCGRLFDAVAAVVLQRREVDYEAQAAIELEGIAIHEPCVFESTPPYQLEMRGGNWSLREPMRLGVAPLWSGIIDELRRGENKARIAGRFHASIAAGFVKTCALAREATGIGRVAMSGGCMHNRRLAQLLRMGLEAVGFDVFQHRRISPGDGGLSYGQVAIAAAMLRGERDLRVRSDLNR